MRISKLANALYSDATMSGAALAALSVTGVPSGPLKKAEQRGLWVGGRVDITDDGLRFAANGINRLAHGNANAVWIPMDAIHGVELERGWLTRIVAVQHSHGEFRFRCFGAKSVVAQMREYLSQTR